MDARRGQIRDLLKGARGRIDPAEVGLATTMRRKAPGLRREDVAVLAQVSLKWYTWLEQGRELNFSDDLLHRVSRVLRLTDGERAYLIALARRRPAPATADSARTATDWLQRTVQFAPAPVLAMTLRWDILAWNELTTRIFRDYGAIPEPERNLLRIILSDERYQHDPLVYEQLARKLIAEFRVDFARCAGDPSFDALIAELSKAVPHFERFWNDVELASSLRGTVVQHGRLGQLYFDRISYVPEHQPFTRMLMFVPGDPRTAWAVAELQPPLDAVSIPWSDTAIHESYLVSHTGAH